MAADDHGPKGNGIYSASGASDDGADLTEIAAYAAEVGNRRVGTTAQRQAALTEENGVWEGLIWGDTTDGNEYRFTGGSWGLLLPQVRSRVTQKGQKNAGLGTGDPAYNFEAASFTIPNGRAAIVRVFSWLLIGKQSGTGAAAGRYRLVFAGAEREEDIGFNTQSAPINTPVTLTDEFAFAVVGTGQPMSANWRISMNSSSSPITIWDYRHNFVVEY